MVENLRVAIYMNESGDWEVFADCGVDVYTVDERAPDDLIYQMDPATIPPDMLAGAVGSKDDGSAASVRAKNIEREINGQPRLQVIDGKDHDRTH